MPKQRGGIGILELLFGAAEVGSNLGQSKDYKRMGRSGATGHYKRVGPRRRGGTAIGIDGYFTKKQWENYLRRTGKSYGGGFGSLLKPFTKVLGKKVVKMAGKKFASKAAKKALKHGGKKAAKKAGKKILKKAAKRGTKKIAKKTLVSLGTSAGTALASGAIATGIGSTIKGKSEKKSITPKAADSGPVIAIPTQPPSKKNNKKKKRKT